ncbi:hypothetical protein VNO77_40025 [Canavalia gladiata]|uniref:Transmembrane protein n=1 Tax=Canavalia gladiata TaxID=3824 RepID=A0AAN9K0Z9_CANGL
MASPMKLTLFSACILIFVVVVGAQYGGDSGSNSGSDMPGMNMGPAPHSFASPITPAVITIILSFMLTFLVANERV